MSVVIPNMDMPSSCGDCQLKYISLGALEWKCCLNERIHDVSFQVRDGVRADWCPLIESEGAK